MYSLCSGVLPWLLSAFLILLNRLCLASILCSSNSTLELCASIFFLPIVVGLVSSHEV